MNQLTASRRKSRRRVTRITTTAKQERRAKKKQGAVRGTRLQDGGEPRPSSACTHKPLLRCSKASAVKRF